MELEELTLLLPNIPGLNPSTPELPFTSASPCQKLTESIITGESIVIPMTSPTSSDTFYIGEHLIHEKPIVIKVGNEMDNENHHIKVASGLSSPQYLPSRENEELQSERSDENISVLETKDDGAMTIGLVDEDKVLESMDNSAQDKTNEEQSLKNLPSLIINNLFGWVFALI
jgi:hypothetical protein